MQILQYFYLIRSLRMQNFQWHVHSILVALSMGKSELSTDFRSVCALLLLFHIIETVPVIHVTQLRQLLLRPSLAQQLLTPTNSQFHINHGRTKLKCDNNVVVGPYRRRTYNMIAKIITGNPYRHNSRDIYKKTNVFPLQPFWTFGSHWRGKVNKHVSSFVKRENRIMLQLFHVNRFHNFISLFCSCFRLSSSSGASMDVYSRHTHTRIMDMFAWIFYEQILFFIALRTLIIIAHNKHILSARIWNVSFTFVSRTPH